MSSWKQIAGIATSVWIHRNDRFYEIDASVISLARNPDYFTFLKDSAASIEVVERDGRLALEDERRRSEPGWDVLVLDAFNSDAVPVHLLTREAFSLYVDRLAEGGVLAMHVSNRHLDLTSLSLRLAHEVGVVARMIGTAPAPRYTSGRAHWVVASRDAKPLVRLRDFAATRLEELSLPSEFLAVTHLPAQAMSRAPLWTDDYSDIFSVLR